MSPADEDHHEAELSRVLTQSLEEYKASQAKTHQVGGHWDDSGSELGTDEDEEFKRTLEESKRLHTERTARGPPAIPPRSPRRTPAPENQPSSTAGDGDEALQRALMASEQEGKKHEEMLAKQRTEEEIVLEYVKKQSLLEEELRKTKVSEQEGEAPGS